jgi:hypothetical protein
MRESQIETAARPLRRRDRIQPDGHKIHRRRLASGLPHGQGDK